MIVEKRDITIILLLLFAAAFGFRFFYQEIRDDQKAAMVTPYALIPNTPQAVLAVQRPDLFNRFIEPQQNLYALFQEHTPAIFLSMIQQRPGKSPCLIAYYPEGEILLAPMDHREARQIYRFLNDYFLFSPQELEASRTILRFYPDSERQFLGCYYQEGLFAASYNRRLLTEVLSRQASPAPQTIPELANTGKTSFDNTMLRLFFPNDSLRLQIPLNDSLVWNIRDKWSAIDLYLHENNLCTLHEQTRWITIDTLQNSHELYQAMCDSLRIRLRELFPRLQTTTHIQQDGSTTYLTICAH